MITKYNIDIDNLAVKTNLNRIGNQIYKALCLREEEQEWKKPLETITVELLGMAKIFESQSEILTLACKVQGLTDDSLSFMLYRRSIFECCSLVNKIKGLID